MPLYTVLCHLCAHCKGIESRVHFSKQMVTRVSTRVSHRLSLRHLLNFHSATPEISPVFQQRLKNPTVRLSQLDTPGFPGLRTFRTHFPPIRSMCSGMLTARQRPREHSPTADSPDSITQSQPSRMALAMSLHSSGGVWHVPKAGSKLGGGSGALGIKQATKTGLILLHL